MAGLLMAAFLAVFAADSAAGADSFMGAAPAIAVHLLPAVAVLAMVALAWHFELLGVVGSAAFAVGYAIWSDWRADWMLAISGPLACLAMLYLASWGRERTGRTSP